LRHHRVDQLQPAALASDCGVHAHRLQCGGPEQVDGEPRGLEVGIAGVTLEDMSEEATDVVTADRLTPWPARDWLRHEGVGIGDEERRRQAVGRAVLCRHRDRR
jgi:hypothetical protein